jgi:uncharacterized membrane protein
MLISMLVLALSSFTSYADPITQVTIDPEYQEVEVDVSPGSSGEVGTTVNVTCQKVSPATLVVDLSASVPGGSATLNPASLTFEEVGPETQEVNVTVRIPLLTASSEKTCTISGTWNQGATSGQVEPAVIQVNVLPFSRAVIMSDSPKKDVQKGDSVTFDLEITNNGNSDDVYHFEVANQEELKGNGITVNKVNDIPFMYKSTETVEVKVHVSSDAGTDRAQIDIVVTSALEEEPEEFSYTLRLGIKEKPISLEFFTSPLVLAIILIIIISVIFIFVKKKKGLNQGFFSKKS